MTNTQKALELINTFASGDTEKAAALLASCWLSGENDCQKYSSL